jgi:hypothetical protein
LTWVLAQVDTSVAEGRTVEVHSLEPLESAFSWQRAARTGSPAKPSVTNRPLTAVERVNYMIDALERVVIDVPAISKHSWGQLNSGYEGRLPMIDGVAFNPDEDSVGDEPTDVNEEGLPSAAGLEDLRTLLNQLRREAHP